MIYIQQRGSASPQQPAACADEVVASDEVVQVFTLKRIGFQGEMLVGAKIVNPESPRPRRFAGWLAIEEKDVGLYALGMKNAGWQPQQRMEPLT